MANFETLALIDSATFTAAIERFPMMKSILEEVRECVFKRQAEDSALIKAHLYITTYRLVLYLTRNENRLLTRYKRLPRGFWSERFLVSWQNEEGKSKDFSCSFEYTPTGVVAKYNHESYVYNVFKDNKALSEAVTTLETLPDILFEAHFDSSVLSRRMIAFYNEYLIDLFDTDVFQCLSKEHFDRLHNERLFVEARATLERCGKRLALFRLILGPIDVWLRSGVPTGLPKIDKASVDYCVLVREFRSKLLQVWTSY